MEQVKKLKKVFDMKKKRNMDNFGFNSNEIRNHMSYFTSTPIRLHTHLPLAVFLLLVGVIAIFISISKNTPAEFFSVMTGLALIVAVFLFILPKFDITRPNLKGFPINIEKDLNIGTHYVVKRVIPEFELCQLGIKYPQISHQLPWADAKKLSTETEVQNVPFAPGLEFFIRQDGTFVFVHPLPALPTKEVKDAE